MVHLPGLKKAVAATRHHIKRSVKKEPAEDNTDPLGDSPVIIDDEEEKPEPLIVPDKSQGGGKELKVDIETPTFKPVTEYRVQKARRGMRFRPGDSSRMDNVQVKPVDTRYNELEAAKSLVGLSEPQPKTGSLCSLCMSEEKTQVEEIKDSSEQNKDHKEEKDSLKEEKDTKEEKAVTTNKTKGKGKKTVSKEKVSKYKETKDKVESKAEEAKVVEEWGNICDQVQSLIYDGMNEEDTTKKLIL